jgi:hypothetical protein
MHKEVNSASPGAGSISGRRGEPQAPMEKLVPLISGSRSGPLGIAHLPRFWLKMRAYAVGLLEDGYRHGNGGNDESLLTTFGIDLDAFTDFIAGAPDYPACEAWVRKNAAGISAETIRKYTEQLIAFEMPDPRRTEWTARFGLTPGTYTLAVALNQLDDWDLVHHQLRDANAPKTAVVPAISTAVSGPLGVLHLPRLWIKRRAHAAGRLPAGYRLGAPGFDGTLADALGFAYDELAAYIDAERPDYLATEAWVRKNAKTLTDETVAALNARIMATKLPAQFAPAMRARLGVDESFERSIPLNDLDDWLTLHEQLKAVAAV